MTAWCVFDRGQPMIETMARERGQAIEKWKNDRSPEANGWHTMEAIGEVRCVRVLIEEAR